MRYGKGNLETSHKWALALLVVVPLLVTGLKWDVLPTADYLRQYVSLAELPAETHGRLAYVLFVPLGAILVVLCRLTLGIRVLGPFRSILLAVAFQITGILVGMAFLVVVIVVIVIVRPPLKAMRLPYFGRVSVLLSLISVIVIATILLGEWIGSGLLHRVAYFPIVVLCLTGDAFARTLVKEGAVSALWRGAMTATVAALLTFLSQLDWLRHLLLAYPELLVLQIGAIVAISEYLDLRLLQWLNPSADGEEDEERSAVVLGGDDDIGWHRLAESRPAK